MADIAPDQFHRMRKIAPRPEGALPGDRLDDVLLLFAEHVVDLAEDERLPEAARPVELVVVELVVDAVEAEIEQPRHDDLRPLGEEEILEVVVAEGGELHIDLPHHADQHLLLRFAGEGREVGDDRVVVAAHRPVAQGAAPLHLVGQPVRPAVDERVGDARLRLVGTALVGQQHEQVAVGHRVKDAVQHHRREGKARVFLHPVGREGDDRHESVAAFFQRLAQQVDVVGRAAAAARLGDEQRHLVHVPPSRFERVDHLADDEQRRVAGVVMYVAQAAVHHPLAAVLQKLRPVAVLTQDVEHQLEVHRKHGGHEDRIVALHLFGKEDAFVIL